MQRNDEESVEPSLADSHRENHATPAVRAQQLGETGPLHAPEPTGATQPVDQRPSIHRNPGKLGPQPDDDEGGHCPGLS